MKKGLRHAGVKNFRQIVGLKTRPDEEGIKTIVKNPSSIGVSLEDSP